MRFSRRSLCLGASASLLAALAFACAGRKNSMTRYVSNGPVRLFVESFGADGAPAVVMIMGATASMNVWPVELCERIAARGYRAIRFDHRDTGQSTSYPVGSPGYAAEDLAGDVLAVMDGFGLAQAHLVGMSLGAYLAQMIAVDRPERVSSLTLVAAEPLGWDGDPLPHISEKFLAHFGQIDLLDWSDRAQARDFLLGVARLSAGSRYPFDEAGTGVRIDADMARTQNLATAFNHSAMPVRRDWTGAYRKIERPVFVIHGEEDPVLPPANGKAIAEGIEGARFRVLEGVGHELPPALVPELAAIMTDFMDRAT